MALRLSDLQTFLLHPESKKKAPTLTPSTICPPLSFFFYSFSAFKILSNLGAGFQNVGWRCAYPTYKTIASCILSLGF